MICAIPEDLEVRIGSRNAERVSVAAPVDATSGDKPLVVLIHDLCITGARIESRQANLQAGDIMRLRLPLLRSEQAGEIAWAEGDVAGVQFSEPLHPATFQILAKAMQPPKK